MPPPPPPPVRTFFSISSILARCSGSMPLNISCTTERDNMRQTDINYAQLPPNRYIGLCGGLPFAQ